MLDIVLLLVAGFVAGVAATVVLAALAFAADDDEPEIRPRPRAPRTGGTDRIETG